MITKIIWDNIEEFMLENTNTDFELTLHLDGMYLEIDRDNEEISFPFKEFLEYLAKECEIDLKIRYPRNKDIY